MPKNEQSQVENLNEAMHDLRAAIVEAWRLEQIVVWIDRQLVRLKCRLGFHEWDMYASFHDEKPHHYAKCINCKKPYERGNYV